METKDFGDYIELDPDEIDASFVGEIHPETGLVWDAEWGYVETDFKYAYNVWQGDDGVWNCWVVYMGSWNVEISILEEKFLEAHFGRDSQKYYEWLYNHRRKSDNVDEAQQQANEVGAALQAFMDTAP